MIIYRAHLYSTFFPDLSAHSFLERLAGLQKPSEAGIETGRKSLLATH